MVTTDIQYKYILNSHKINEGLSAVHISQVVEISEYKIA